VRLEGEAPAMQEVHKMIGRLATNDVPALIVGERGTGKELVAATIHANSGRRDGPFVTVDCATLDDATLESELTAAAGGTLHLAEVHALSRPLQARVLRAARGAPTPRLIASTAKATAELVEDESFNREFYELLAVITLRVPPLRERSEDIALLVRSFTERFNEELNRTIKGVDEQVLQRLQEHDWPGNVGELESVVKRACIITRGDVITLADIGGSLSENRFAGRQDAESALCRAARVALQERLVDTTAAAEASAFHDIVSLVETTLVKEALSITNGNQVKASELLGLNRATLRKKASTTE
jgi:two-component system nitrogen regulation response regulator GlnG